MKHGLLISYHYLGCRAEELTWQIWKEAKARGVGVVLDSGAFSASTLGAPISVLDYGKFVSRFHGKFDWVASLDVIGDHERTWKNWQVLRQYHEEIVPCVHYGSPPEEALRYVKAGATRLALGGLVPHRASLKRSDSEPSRWLDQIFRSLSQHAPLIPVHGFGVSGPDVLGRYRWTTVDSTTAINNAMFRKLLVYKDGLLKALKHDEKNQDARTMAAVADSWEVRRGCDASPTRKARIKAAMYAMHGLGEDSGLRILYHASVPNKCDVGAILEEAARLNALKAKR